MISFLCVLLIIFLIIFRDTAIDGALSGLMIWYQCVVPVLLPFILISNVFVNNYRKNINLSHSGQNELKAVISTVFLGLLCGYPIGAKTGAELLKSGAYDKKTLTLLLPLCNNASPMFIAGYIHKQVMLESIPLSKLFLAIYLPYFLFFIPVILKLIKHKNHDKVLDKKINPTDFSKKHETKSENSELLLSSLRQITIIGIYIMIFSIFLEFIINLNLDNTAIKSAGAFLEITRGTDFASGLDLPLKTKTALITSITSFGGISAIYQTNEVIKDSGLSIIHYTILKTLGGFLSGILIYMF